MALLLQNTLIVSKVHLWHVISSQRIDKWAHQLQQSHGGVFNHVISQRLAHRTFIGRLRPLPLLLTHIFRPTYTINNHINHSPTYNLHAISILPSQRTLRFGITSFSEGFAHLFDSLRRL